MHTFTFSYKNSCGITQDTLQACAQKHAVAAERERIAQVLSLSSPYDNRYASVALAFDQQLLEQVKKVVNQKQKLQPTLLLVIGIGGSSLGAKAVLQALKGRLAGVADESLRVYFAETVDTDRMVTLLALLERELQAGHAVLVNVITKSGTTTETIANFYVVLELLKKYRPDTYQALVVVTTDRESQLWHSAHASGFAVLEVPKLVGGRFSVFSAVGLFPLLMAGVDVDQLRAGARATLTRCLQGAQEDDVALTSAMIHYLQYRQGVMISDLFLFSVDLEAVGKWYRQLLAESIGKEWDTQGNQVFVGITPTVSLGSVDLHSVAQLYLGGPRDKFTTFVTVKHSAHTVTVPEGVSFVGGKSFATIMHALAEGTQTAYLKNGRPFCSVVLQAKDAWSIGQFLQFKMLETMYLGYLLQVDPFDQPNVDLYKQEAHRLLSGQ